MDEQKLSELIGTIYDAPLIGDWRCSLQMIHLLADCTHTVLMTHDMRTNLQTPVGSRDPSVEARYIDQYMPLNEAWPPLARQEVGKPVLERDVLNMDQYQKSTFFNEFARPNNMITSAGGVISREDGVITALVVSHKERSDSLEALDLALLSLLLPHFRRALALWRGREALAEGNLSLWDMADGLPTGILIVDDAGRVFHMNAVASDIVRRESRHMLERGPHANGDTLQSGIVSALRRSATSKPGCPPATTGALRLELGEQTYLLTMVPLQGSPGWVGTRRTCFAVLLSDLAGTPTSAAKMLAELFDLTAAEARMAVQLGGDGNLSDIAARLGIRLSTAKTLLSRGLSKTGTHSQSQLARLVERLSAHGRAAPVRWSRER